MASSTEICNLALSHLGIAKPIANLSTEQSQEASVCRAFYEVVRDTVLRDYRWPFATKITDLNLVEEDPNDEWSFSYRYPSDCLEIRRILSGVRNDTVDTRVLYKIGADDAGKLLFTDREDAQAEYTMRVTDTQFFPTDFVLALSFRLAAYIAPRVTAGDPFKLGERAMQMYIIEASKATATSFNEEQLDGNPDPDLYTIRNG